jgi:hypothetical protein
MAFRPLFRENPNGASAPGLAKFQPSRVPHVPRFWRHGFAAEGAEKPLSCLRARVYPCRNCFHSNAASAAELRFLSAPGHRLIIIVEYSASCSGVICVRTSDDEKSVYEDLFCLWIIRRKNEVLSRLFAGIFSGSRCSQHVGKCSDLCTVRRVPRRRSDRALYSCERLTEAGKPSA